MAPFAFDLIDEDQKKKEDAAAQQGAGGAPAMTGGGQTFSGSTEAKPTEQKGAQTQGSGFVNLNQYMDANKGNNFGNQVEGKVQGTVDQAKNDFNKGAEDFTNASNQSTTHWGDVQGQLKNVVDNAGDKTSKDDFTNVQNWGNTSYKGPDNFLGSAYGAGAQGSVQKASQQAGALNSEGGRFALLDQYYGKPQYTQGQKSLDNLLVQNTPGVAARAHNLDSQAKELSSTAQQKTQDLDNLASTNKQETNQVGGKVKDYVNQAETGFQTDLQKRYQDYLDQNKTLNAATRADLSDDTVNADTLNQTGLTAGQKLYGLNLSDYLQDGADPSLQQYASNDDYGKYLALSQMAGTSPDLLSPDARANAGTGLSMGRVGFDKNRFDADVAAQQAGYNSDLDKAAFDYNDFVNMGGGTLMHGGTASMRDLQNTLSRIPQNYDDYADPQTGEMLSSKYAKLQDMMDKFNQAHNVGRTLQKQG